MAKYIFQVEDLFLSKNAQFFKLNKSLTKSKVNALYKVISDKKEGANLIKKVREEYLIDDEVVIYSILSFKLIEEPSFLTGTDITESKYAYVLLVELPGFLIISKKNVDGIDNDLDKFIEYFEFDKFSNFNGRLNPEYEKISMTNMSLSNSVIKNRTIEARKLNGILSPNTTGRSVPGSFRMKNGMEIFTLTPNTSRIGYKDKKVDFVSFCSWAIETVNELSNTNSLSSKVMAGFSSPITLKSLLNKNIVPKAIFIDLNELDDLVRGEDSILTLSKMGVNGMIPLSSQELEKLFDGFKSPFSIDNNRLERGNVKYDCLIKYNSKVITIRSKYLEKINLMSNGEEIGTLNSYLNKIKPFTVTFDSPQYCYHERSCFEDKTMMNNLTKFLSIFDDSYNFNTVKSEKEKTDGTYPPYLIRFPVRSLFRRIENIYNTQSAIIICDDMNDEWADHIVLDTDSAKPSIKFIHEKFIQQDSYGASKFHEVVSQALKNIGRLNAPKELYQEKFNNDWSGMYQQTQIRRVRPVNKTWDDIENSLNKLNENPKTIREIILATPFLSKRKLEISIEELIRTGTTKPFTVQLIWLINTFISCCSEYGVRPSVLCRK